MAETMTAAEIARRYGPPDPDRDFLDDVRRSLAAAEDPSERDAIYMAATAAVDHQAGDDQSRAEALVDALKELFDPESVDSHVWSDGERAWTVSELAEADPEFAEVLAAVRGAGSGAERLVELRECMAARDWPEHYLEAFAAVEEFEVGAVPVGDTRAADGYSPAGESLSFDEFEDRFHETGQAQAALEEDGPSSRLERLVAAAMETGGPVGVDSLGGD